MLSGMALMPGNNLTYRRGEIRFIDVGQIRGVDHSRVLGLVGMLEQEYWEIIHTALNVVLGFVV